MEKFCVFPLRRKVLACPRAGRYNFCAFGWSRVGYSTVWKTVVNFRGVVSRKVHGENVVFAATGVRWGLMGRLGQRWGWLMGDWGGIERLGLV